MAAEDKWRNVAAVKYALFIALLLPVFALFTPRASAEEPLKGVALVIGESAYQALPALPSPGRDARAIKDLLARLGFKTTLATDEPTAKLHHSIEGFIQDANGADVALIYYAGHGIEAGGVNYMIATDADLNSLETADHSLISLHNLLGELRAKAKLTILLLDACRSSPFPKYAVIRRDAGSAGEAISTSGLCAPHGAPAPSTSDRLSSMESPGPTVPMPPPCSSISAPFRDMISAR